MIRRLLLCVFFALLTQPAFAHEVRPAYLEISETASSTFEVVWKAPAIPAGVLAVTPEFPAHCVDIAPRHAEAAPGALVTRWRVRCAEGLTGVVRFDGLDRTLTSVFVRVRTRDGEREGVVANGEPAFALEESGPPQAGAYLMLGVQHILEGFDHLAFVVGLVLVVSGWRLLLVTLTAFTLAHSLTLAAAALGFVGLPQRPVEAVIAFSIAVVAREIVLAARGDASALSRAPWAVAFGFGLLHGFGFAGALREIGLPEGARAAALILFNVGVELGQLVVVAVLAPLVLLLRRAPHVLRARAEFGAGAALGAMAMFWLYERLL